MALDLSCCFRRMIFVLVQKREREREKEISVVRRIFVLVQKRERDYYLDDLIFYKGDILRGYCSNEIQDSVSKYENREDFYYVHLF